MPNFIKQYVTVSILHVCSESSKNQPAKKAYDQTFRSAELQKFARKFSHGLVSENYVFWMTDTEI